MLFEVARPFTLIFCIYPCTPFDVAFLVPSINISQRQMVCGPATLTGVAPYPRQPRSFATT